MSFAVERFDQRSPHCNKIQQLHTFAGAGYDQIVLMDCDTAWVGGGKLPIGAPISACIVDAANPPERILLNIFNASGLGAPKWARVGFPMGSGHEFTDANNCNGGLYICDREFVPKLARFWRFWALWCLDRSELLEAFTVHADQISFALAMREMGASVHHLPIAWNYPTHLRVEGLPDVSPQVIHYHHGLTAELTIKTVGIPTVDRTIGHLNDAIEGFLRCRPLGTVLQKFRDDLDRGPAQTGYGSIADIATQPSSRPLRATRHRSTSIRGDLGKVVVGSGWWCDEEPHEWAIGSPTTRSVAFFDLWYRQVLRGLQPDRIVITDSASPIKPDYPSYSLVQWIDLDRNYGHANDIRVGRISTKYSGVTRSLMNGAMYALCCDADFYVFVEQGCVLRGDDFLRHALGDSTADILLGAPTENGKGIKGSVAAPMLQMSLIIVRRAGLERFLQAILGSPWTDGECSPEEMLRRQLAPFDLVRVPYGRSRPIDFRRSHFYAKHLDEDELKRFLHSEGIALGGYGAEPAGHAS
jgi:hypothetical protein